MGDWDAVDALVTDLQWQIDEMAPRGIKNNGGQPYIPSHYKRGLQHAIDDGVVADYVKHYLYKPPTDAYKRLESAGSLDLTCESLVADETKLYTHLFSDADREAARERLAPHVEAIEARKAEYRARIEAATQRLRAKGIPRRSDLDSAVRSRRSS
jgi:hypothetical protein